MLIERNERTQKELAIDPLARRLEIASPPDIRAELRQARAAFKLAYANLQRAMSLAIQAAGTLDDLDAVAEVWTDDPIPDAACERPDVEGLACAVCSLASYGRDCRNNKI